MAPRSLTASDARAMSLNRTTRAAGPGRTPRMVCCLACRQEMPWSTLMHVHRWRGRCDSLAATQSLLAADIVGALPRHPRAS